MPFLVTTVLILTTAPPPGFTGTPLTVRDATAGGFGEASPVKIDLGTVKRSTAVPGLADKPRTFWEQAELVARATQTRPELAGEAGPLRFAGAPLKPGESSCFGAFRTAVKRVRAVQDFDSSQPTYDVELELLWEPQLPVFRASAEPKIVHANDDRNTVLRANPSSVRTTTNGIRHGASIKLLGLTRASKTIAQLDGEFRVTASRALLPFEFIAPAVKTSERVSVNFVSLVRVEDRWEATCDLSYPAGGPVFESFEADAYLAGNVATLILNGKEHAPASYELTERGPQTRAIYRFKGLPAALPAYTLRYRTPTPPVEFAVPFQLAGLPLP
jgi:hypothetical protein